MFLEVKSSFEYKIGNMYFWRLFFNVNISHMQTYVDASVADNFLIVEAKG